MTISPHIHIRTEQPYLALRTTALLSDWGNVNVLIPQLLTIMSNHDVTPAGPLFYRYLIATDVDQPFTVEVGFPTTTFVPCTGAAHPATIPAGRYATATHVGHPDRLRDSFATLEQWIAHHGEQADTNTANGQCHWAGRFEFYLTDPAQQPDPDQWEIELAWKLRNTQ